MKKTKIRVFAAFLIAGLLLGGCNLGIKIPAEITELSLPYVDKNIVTIFDIVLPQQKYLALASENQQLMYKAMLMAIKDQSEQTLEIPGDLTDEEVKEVYEAVADDYPQFFEPSITYQIVRVQTGDKVKSVSCQLSYIENDPEIAAQRRQALYDKVNAILAEAATVTDPLQRERFFYETVIRTAQYDSNQAGLFNIDLNTHTAFGALVNGSAVCDGYAKAFALLCNYGGIETWVESGYLEGTISHAWNGVKIDGKIYYCDPTIDDAENRYYGDDHAVQLNPDNTEGLTALPAVAVMLNFNLTRAEMSADHSFDSAPNADDASDSSAVTQGALTRFSSRSELAAWMAQTLATAPSGSGFAIAADFSIPVSGFGEMISGAGIQNTCLFTQNGAGTRFYIYVI